jgi:O-antigen/teichoic acid export membrane protein
LKIPKLNSDFAKSVTTLVTGTVLSQLIVFALSPIISRLYTPEETANFSIYTRIIIFVSTLATARFESALALPKRNEHAFSLYRLIVQLVLISFFASIFLSIIYVFYGAKSKEESFIYLMVPLGFAPLCMMNIGNGWAMRLGQFKEISRVRMLNSLSMNLSNVLFGWLGFGYKGLILGYIIGVSLPGAWFTRKYHLLKLKYKDFSFRSRRKVIGKTYIDFPKVNLPHALMDITRELLIVFFILLFFNKNVLGSYDFSFKMLKLPLTVIGGAIGQVYFQKIASMKNKGESLFEITIQTMRNLFLISIVPFSVLFLWGEELFSFVFGQEWTLAGRYSEIMAPWLMMNLVVSPVSQLPVVLGKLKAFFWVGLIGSVLLVGFLNIPHFNLNISFDDLLFYINWTQFLFLFIVMVWFVKLAKSSQNLGFNNNN